MRTEDKRSPQEAQAAILRRFHSDKLPQPISSFPNTRNNSNQKLKGSEYALISSGLPDGSTNYFS
jgi:hypothetical protein